MWCRARTNRPCITSLRTRPGIIERHSRHPAEQRIRCRAEMDGDVGVLDRVARDANTLLGGTDDSFLVIDETGFPKKGRDSVGVGRQWCGRLGKVDNCQTAVCASLGTGSIATLIDTALFLPKEWTQDRARMKAVGVPEAFQNYRTKQELALDLIERALAKGVRFSWIGFDGFYGDNGQFLRMLEGAGLTFVGDVH